MLRFLRIQHLAVIDRLELEFGPGLTVLTGETGAGKSILLLKLREHLEMQHRGSSLFAPRGGSRVYTPSAEFANSVSYTAFWKLERKGRPDLNAWTQLWEWALLLCVLAHWKKWSEDGPQLHLERLSALCEANGDDPFASIASFLNRDQQSRPSGTAQLPPTQDMRAFVESYANDFPPTYVFLDSQDDFFQDSPDFWTASALGCRNAIDQILRRSNHRLHLVMTVRPEMRTARPDVAAIYGQRFLKSGYGLRVAGLAPGTYDLAVFAYSTVQGRFVPAKTARIVITPR